MAAIAVAAIAVLIVVVGAIVVVVAIVVAIVVAFVVAAFVHFVHAHLEESLIDLMVPDTSVLVTISSVHALHESSPVISLVLGHALFCDVPVQSTVDLVS